MRARSHWTSFVVRALQSLIVEVLVVSFVFRSASPGWLLFIGVWILVLWFAHRPAGRNLFGRRLDQFLVLLLPQVETNRGGTIAALKRDTLRAFRGQVVSGELRRFARRRRAQLGAVYTHGYQVAAETISSSAEVVHGSDLVRKTVEALKAERTSGGATVPAAEDPVVVVAYGLGVWPPGADLTSLEELLGELGVSHEALGPASRASSAPFRPQIRTDRFASSPAPRSFWAPQHESSKPHNLPSGTSDPG